MKPLNLCFISQEYPPETGWGGIGSYTYEMAHGLAALGHRVVVISRAVNHETIKYDQGVEIHRILPAPDWKRFKGGWILNRFWPGFAWASAVRLTALHKKSPFQLIEAAEGRADGFFLPYLLRPPKRVVRLHTAWIFVDRFNSISPDLKKKFVYFQEKCVIQRSHSISSPSQAMVDMTAQWLPGVKNKLKSIIPNLIDTRIFNIDSNIEKEKSIVFVGRLEKIKGIKTIIQTLNKILLRHPDFIFRFIGSVDYQLNGLPVRDYVLNNVPASMQYRIIFEQVKRSELPKVLLRASVCVLPSLWENFPYALLEAMSCGIPVVATRVGGMIEMIEDCISGFLIPPNDPDTFVDAISEILENTALQQEMGNAARRRVESSYSLPVILPRMLDYYQEIIES